jgi:hypothetical protein
MLLLGHKVKSEFLVFFSKEKSNPIKYFLHFKPCQQANLLEIQNFSKNKNKIFKKKAFLFKALFLGVIFLSKIK